MIDNRQPAISDHLLVVVGPTASGKTALAIDVAERVQGEIICADSRTVYKGMDIGTAKPGHEEQERVRHHLLDIVEPDEDFTAADFKRLANQSIQHIRSRDHLPMLVGGSGLYIDAVLYDYAFSPADVPRDESNPRHVAKSVPQVRKPMRQDAIVVGLNVPREILKQRISERIEAMLEAGFLDEVRRVQAKFSGSKAMLAPGYRAFSEHIAGRLSIEEAKALFITYDLALAKRQMTWFRRNKNIHWLDNPDTYIEQTLELLNKLH